MLESCLQNDDSDAARRMLACSAAVASRKLSGRALAMALVTRGGAYRAMGDDARSAIDFGEAVRIFDGVIAAREPLPGDLVQRGTALQALGRPDRALLDYNAAIRLDPRNARALVNRGVVLATFKQEFGSAILDFSTALAIVPDSVEALVLRGDAQARTGELAHALADLDRAHRLAPDNASILVARGLVRSRRGESALALADYNTALALHPDEVAALVNRAAIHAAGGDHDGAIADLDKALALQPSDALAWYNRGVSHFARGQYRQAISNYTAALGIDPGLAVAWSNRCLSRTVAAQELDQAVADCDKALETRPDDVDIRTTRGFVFLKRGEPQKAMAEYEAALKADANRPIALYGRGLARIRTGDGQGEADRAAARALAPSIDQAFTVFGLQ